MDFKVSSCQHEERRLPEEWQDTYVALIYKEKVKYERVRTLEELAYLGYLGKSLVEWLSREHEKWQNGEWNRVNVGSWKKMVCGLGVLSEACDGEILWKGQMCV